MSEWCAGATLLASVTATAWHIGPAASWLPGVRVLLPRLAGAGRDDHVALTFDDGPAADSTPQVLAALDELGLRATFFVLGRAAAANRALVAEMAAAGHELAVHGWDHGYLLGRSTHRVREDLARARDVVGELCGSAPVWFRPAYGVLTGPALAAARELTLQSILWTVWGRDWDADATGTSVFAQISPGLCGGATVLLHDARPPRRHPRLGVEATIAALPQLAAAARQRKLTMGPLVEHGLPRRIPAARRSAARDDG
jgi:peptidoglycan/xylan/chitin deacetylase (PgdA/CDA1 family)